MMREQALLVQDGGLMERTHWISLKSQTLAQDFSLKYPLFLSSIFLSTLFYHYLILVFRTEILLFQERIQILH